MRSTAVIVLHTKFRHVVIDVPLVMRMTAEESVKDDAIFLAVHSSGVAQVQKPPSLRSCGCDTRCSVIGGCDFVLNHVEQNSVAFCILVKGGYAARSAECTLGQEILMCAHYIYT